MPQGAPLFTTPDARRGRTPGNKVGYCRTPLFTIGSLLTDPKNPPAVRLARCYRESPVMAQSPFRATETLAVCSSRFTTRLWAVVPRRCLKWWPLMVPVSHWLRLVCGPQADRKHCKRVARRASGRFPRVCPTWVLRAPHTLEFQSAQSQEKPRQGWGASSKKGCI